MSIPRYTKENIMLQKALATQYASDYCKKNGLSVEKLKKQRFNLTAKSMIFSNPSEVEPKGLVNDIETMPKPTLIIFFDGDSLRIEETEHTKKYLS